MLSPRLCLSSEARAGVATPVDTALAAAATAGTVAEVGFLLMCRECEPDFLESPLGSIDEDFDGKACSDDIALEASSRFSLFS
jgi:hypothetical protein